MNTVLQKYGGASQGDMLITCATIAQSYMLLITSPMLGISGGTQAILSYNYGARRADRVKKAEKNILGLMLIFTTIMFLLSRLVSRFFVLLFTSDPQYTDFSVWAIRTYTMMIDSSEFPVCLRGRSDCPGAPENCTGTLCNQKKPFCIECNPPAVLLRSKNCIFRRTTFRWYLFCAFHSRIPA